MSEGVKVHSSLLYEDLMQASFDPSGRGRVPVQDDNARPPTERRKRRNQKKLDMYKAQTTKMLADQEKQSKEIYEKTKAKREAHYNQMLKKLESETAFLEKIDEFLALKEHTDRRRQQRLYKDWHKRVYSAIQTQIDKQLAATPTADIEARRRALYDEFLAAANRKDGLFRDIITAEYDPFKGTRRAASAGAAGAGAGAGWSDDEKRAGTGGSAAYSASGGPLTYTTGRIRDPLKQDIVRVERERRLIEGATPGSSGGSGVAGAGDSAVASILSPVTRDGLDILLWSKLESTPHGRYAKMFADAADRADGHAVARPNEAPRLANTKSTLILDHYNVTTDPKVVKSEFFPKGKKCGARPDQKSNGELLKDLPPGTSVGPVMNVARARRMNEVAARAAAARSRVLPAFGSSSAEQRPLASVMHDSFVAPTDQKAPPRPRKAAQQLTAHIKAGHNKVLSYAEQMHAAAEEVRLQSSLDDAAVKRAARGGRRSGGGSSGAASASDGPSDRFDIGSMTYAKPPPPPVAAPAAAAPAQAPPSEPSPKPGRKQKAAAASVDAPTPKLAAPAAAGAKPQIGSAAFSAAMAHA